MAYIMKPNGLVAEIGDTNSSLNTTSISNTSLSVFDNEYLTYASSLGEKGNKPEERSKVYPSQGIILAGTVGIKKLENCLHG